jgi:glycopeptide antibiotics resistance protein
VTEPRRRVEQVIDWRPTTGAVVLRWTSAGLLGLYALIVMRLTLEPAGSESAIFGQLNRFATAVSRNRLAWSQTEALANVALFIPLGFLLAVVLSRVGPSAALCVLASVFIELIQARFLPSRVPTIDDVWHNSAGGAVGAALAWPITLWLRSHPPRFWR